MKKSLQRRLALIPAFLLATGQAAFAAVPAGVTTALTDAETDVTTIGVAVFAVMVAIVIFKWFRRAL